MVCISRKLQGKVPSRIGQSAAQSGNGERLTGRPCDEQVEADPSTSWTRITPPWFLCGRYPLVSIAGAISTSLISAYARIGPVPPFGHVPVVWRVRPVVGQNGTRERFNLTAKNRLHAETMGGDFRRADAAAQGGESHLLLPFFRRSSPVIFTAGTSSLLAPRTAALAVRTLRSGNATIATSPLGCPMV